MCGSSHSFIAPCSLKTGQDHKSTRIQVWLWRWLCCSEYDDCLWKGKKFQAWSKFKCHIHEMSDRFDCFYSSKLFKDSFGMDNFGSRLATHQKCTRSAWRLTSCFASLQAIDSIDLRLKMTGTVWHLFSEFYCSKRLVYQFFVLHACKLLCSC